MKRDLLRAVARLSNRDLVGGLKLIVRKEDETTAEVIAHLAEVETRRLHLAHGFPSLFLYCVRVLHLSEHAAYNRIQAARVARRWPPVLEQLSGGFVNLTTISLLCPHLTTENHRRLLEETTHKSRRQVEEIVARLKPKDDAAPTIRKLPETRPAVGPANACNSDEGGQRPGGYDALSGLAGGMNRMAADPSRGVNETAADPSRGVNRITAPGDRPGHLDDGSLPAATSPVPADEPRGNVTPHAPGRYRIQFTAGAGTYGKFLKARDLLRHQVPDGNPALVFDRALTILVVDLERRRFAEVTRPRQKEEGGSGLRPSSRPSRHIAADVRRAVWKRDGGRCAFRSPDGHRCPETGWLEFHHRRAHARGGPATEENIELRCRSHNQYEADLEFGPRPARNLETSH